MKVSVKSIKDPWYQRSLSRFDNVIELKDHPVNVMAITNFCDFIHHGHDKRYRPTLRFSGSVVRIDREPQFPMVSSQLPQYDFNITELTFPNNAQPSIDVFYEFSNAQLTALIQKGYFEPNFKVPGLFTSPTMLWNWPMDADISIIPPAHQDEPPLIFVGIKDQHNFVTDAEWSGYELTQFFEDVFAEKDIQQAARSIEATKVYVPDGQDLLSLEEGIVPQDQSVLYDDYDARSAKMVTEYRLNKLKAQSKDNQSEHENSFDTTLEAVRLEREKIFKEKGVEEISELFGEQFAQESDVTLDSSKLRNSDGSIVMPDSDTLDPEVLHLVTGNTQQAKDLVESAEQQLREAKKTSTDNVMSLGGDDGVLELNEDAISSSDDMLSSDAPVFIPGVSAESTPVSDGIEASLQKLEAEQETLDLDNISEPEYLKSVDNFGKQSEEDLASSLLHGLDKKYTSEETKDVETDIKDQTPAVEGEPVLSLDDDVDSEFNKNKAIVRQRLVSQHDAALHEDDKPVVKVQPEADSDSMSPDTTDAQPETKTQVSKHSLKEDFDNREVERVSVVTHDQIENLPSPQPRHSLDKTKE